MSTEQNKAVVRRFITEVLTAGSLDVIDELLAPTYRNKAMGDVDLATFKAMLPAMQTVISSREMTIAELVAEGDAVVARFTFAYTLATGEHVAGRGLTYYGLSNGKIVEDDPITSPELDELMAARMGAPGA